MCESKKDLPVYATGFVYLNDMDLTWSDDEPARCTLCIDVEGKNISPIAGQFFMLQWSRSSRLLGRPISISNSWVEEGYPGDIAHTMLEFIIQERGYGTNELLELREGEKVKILGPLGNGFPLPDVTDQVCLVSGGVGVAPIANLAVRLLNKDYGFYASFKSDSYGLDAIPKKVLRIATEDGSEGTQGMLPEILDAKVLKERGYTVVYACGPTPMLKYVQSICEEAGVKSYLSMENRMACGVGACLGCTIRTTEGNKRCCKDGPVFPGDILIFDEEPPKVTERTPDDCSKLELPTAPDLSVEIAGVKFKNPVIAASGTFGYGAEYKDLINLNLLGGICSKGLTLEPKTGNRGVRIYELSHVGMMNSIGLENPGVEHFIQYELPRMLTADTVVIANLGGSSSETYTLGAAMLDQTDVNMIELNISCPNVKAGGMTFGMHPDAAYRVTRAVRDVTEKPLIVKLTPNAPELVDVALAVKAAGADAISLVNTFQALAIDIDSGKPIFDNVCAGYSGPGIKPIALRMVYDVAKVIRKITPDYPIIGLGGITTWRDAIEFIMAGATAVQIGTATFSNPLATINVIDGLRGYMERKNFRNLADFRGVIL